MENAALAARSILTGLHDVMAANQQCPGEA